MELEKVKKYFTIQEFVSKDVYDKYKEDAWQFICPMLLETLLIIRKELGKPMTINNWHKGGQFSQRGLRHNQSPLVKGKSAMYLSAHLMGKAVDFDVQGMSAVEVRNWLSNNSSILPCKIRLENLMDGKPISWVHLDVYQNEKNSKVYLFNV